GGDVDADMDAARSSVNDSWGDFDDVADDDGSVEADPGDVRRDDFSAGPIGSADVGRFVDPPHDLSGVDFAARVDIGGGGEEMQRGAGGGALGGVALGGHGALDAFAHAYPDSRLPVPLQFKHRHRCPLGDLDRISGVVDSDENDWALRGLTDFGAGGIAGVDGDEDVQTAA